MSTMTTNVTQARKQIRYLRMMLRLAEDALTERDGVDLEEICGEIDGTSAQLREFAELLQEKRSE